MFGRRKNNDGFGMDKYIRTTVKLRREQRRQRVHDARRAAGQQVHAAGSALAAGSRAAGAAARDGARAGVGAAGLAAQGFFSLTVALLAHIFSLTAALLAHIARRIAVAARPLIELVARPPIGGALAFVGGIALGAGIGRYRGVGLDQEALTALVAAAVLLMLILPMLSRLTGIRLPSISVSPQLALGGVLAAALIGIIGWFANHGTGELASLSSRIPLVGASKPVEGNAQVLGGDLLRVGSTTVRLAGIEAPERGQNCGGTGKGRWGCAAAAESALSRLTGGRTVRCTVSGTDDNGHALATCSNGRTDINAELVRGGYVFASSGLFGGYASVEREAKSAKAGLWSGDNERPSEYRSKIWEEAKRRAPDGCPIKGLVSRRGPRLRSSVGDRLRPRPRAEKPRRTLVLF